MKWTVAFLSVALQSFTSGFNSGFVFVNSNGRVDRIRLWESSDENNDPPTIESASTMPPINTSPIVSQQPEDVAQPRSYELPPPRDALRALGTSPRRIAISFLSASGIALAGNFLGVTSQLLMAVSDDTVEASGLDTYFPRGDFKRCRSNGYTFVVPKEWVADTFIELAKVQRQTQPLDYQVRRRPVAGTLPDSAYGPPGRLNQKGVSESGDTNVSVIVTSGLRGFSLQGTLGPPEKAAETLLQRSIAPEGSGRIATLVYAVEDPSRGGIYQFEYTVDRGAKGAPRRNISVVAASSQGDKLFTLTVVAPMKQWENAEYALKLRKIASSFHLTG